MNGLMLIEGVVETLGRIVSDLGTEGSPLGDWLADEIAQVLGKAPLLRYRRDCFLREASRLVEDGSTWARCVSLAKEIATFEARIWKRWRDLEVAPPGCSDLRACLFRARKLGELPTTTRQLYTVVSLKPNPTIHFSFSHDTLTEISAGDSH